MVEETFQIKNYSFSQDAVDNLAISDHLEENWPVVYQIYNDSEIYIGETTNLKNRMNQHLANAEKSSLRKGSVKVVFDKTFNKSAALDLESYLIQYFSGDGRYKVLNRNDGMQDSDYYRRRNYRKIFEEIWDRLHKLGVADHTISEIRNSEIFKFSPYKNLNLEQMNVVSEILQNLDEAISNNKKSLSIIGGKYGTGKTIVIMYLAKLLVDLQMFDKSHDDIDDESKFTEFFKMEVINQRFKGKRIALVIPQPSLCERVRLIFRKIDLGNVDLQVFSPVTFANSDGVFDITLVDEAHLLKVGITGNMGRTVKEINKRLFNDEKIHTELDWVMKKSKNVVMVFGSNQRIRPTNIVFDRDVKKFEKEFGMRDYTLYKQMRSEGGEEYIDYIDFVFSNGLHPAIKKEFNGFDTKLFLDIKKFVEAIKEKEEKYGLARMVAGFAWDWKTKDKKDHDSYDIDIDGVKLKWNSTQRNWIGSKNSKNEVGSIYTVQGDDLNYVGVIIGNELQYKRGRFVFNRKSYADKRAMSRSQRQVKEKEIISEEDLLDQVLRVYRVLLSRGIKGAYIYACDEGLRKYLSKYFNVVK